MLTIWEHIILRILIYCESWLWNEWVAINIEVRILNLLSICLWRSNWKWLNIFEFIIFIWVHHMRCISLEMLLVHISYRVLTNIWERYWRTMKVVKAMRLRSNKGLLLLELLNAPFWKNGAWWVRDFLCSKVGTLRVLCWNLHLSKTFLKISFEGDDFLFEIPWKYFIILLTSFELKHIQC